MTQRTRFAAVWLNQLPLLVIMFLWCGCSSHAIEDTCGVAGRDRSCDCGVPTPSGTGIQSCQLNGVWSECTCYSSDPTGTVSSANTGTTVAGAAGAQSDTEASALAAGTAGITSGAAGSAGTAAGTANGQTSGWFWQVLSTPAAPPWLTIAGSGGRKAGGAGQSGASP